MLRASCKILIKKMFYAAKIDEQRKERCLKYIRKRECHEIIRNLIALVLLPRKLDTNEGSQAAYLEAAVMRVSH